MHKQKDQKYMKCKMEMTVLRQRDFLLCADLVSSWFLCNLKTELVYKSLFNAQKGHSLASQNCKIFQIKINKKSLHMGKLSTIQQILLFCLIPPQIPIWNISFKFFSN